MVLGLSHEEVEAEIRTYDQTAVVVHFSPLLGLVLGLGSPKHLRRVQPPSRSQLLSGVALLILWGATASTFLAILLSLFLDSFARFLGMSILLTAVLGLLSTAATVYVIRRTRRRLPEGALESLGYFPWEFLLVPELALAVLALGLFMVLGALLLLVLWLPLVFLALNVLFLGELWRTYRVTQLEMPGRRDESLHVIGRELLRRGATLSKSWDVMLEPQETVLARKRRRAHARVHQALLAFAVSSLALAAVAVASQVYADPQWDQALMAVGVLAGALLLVLVWVLSHRTRLRSAHAGL